MKNESTTNIPGNASFRQKNLYWFVLSNLSLCFFLSVLQVSFWKISFSSYTSSSENNLQYAHKTTSLCFFIAIGSRHTLGLLPSLWILSHPLENFLLNFKNESMHITFSKNFSIGRFFYKKKLQIIKLNKWIKINKPKNDKIIINEQITRY